MAIATTAATSHRNPAATAGAIARKWTAYAPQALAVGGAATVIAGSYMTWATFYAGLVARDGVSGHGKYFIGLAAAAIAAVALSMIRGVSPTLRWLAVPAGLLIAGFALRDLHNLNSLVHDPAAGFYLPGRGDGLFVVIGGAIAMMLSPFASPTAPRLRPLDVRRTLAALAVIASIAMLVPALYGEYYMHLSTAHVHDHGALNTVHLLNIGGVLMLFVAFRLGMMTMKRRPAP